MEEGEVGVMSNQIPEWMVGLFCVTGGVVWILAFAVMVGVIAEKMGAYDD